MTDEMKRSDFLSDEEVSASEMEQDDDESQRPYVGFDCFWDCKEHKPLFNWVVLLDETQCCAYPIDSEHKEFGEGITTAFFNFSEVSDEDVHRRIEEGTLFFDKKRYFVFDSGRRYEVKKVSLFFEGGKKFPEMTGRCSVLYDLELNLKVLIRAKTTHLLEWEITEEEFDQLQRQKKRLGVSYLNFNWIRKDRMLIFDKLKSMKEEEEEEV